MMALSGSKNDDGIISDINITPLVDVILVLLVIFMVTANFLKKESVNINLPKVAAADPNIKESKQLAVTKDGQLYLEYYGCRFGDSTYPRSKVSTQYANNPFCRREPLLRVCFSTHGADPQMRNHQNCPFGKKVELCKTKLFS